MVSALDYHDRPHWNTYSVYSGVSSCTFHLLYLLISILNSSFKKISKIIGINIVVIGIFLITPAIFYRLYHKLKPVFFRQLNQNSDLRAFYPTYTNKNFSIELFNELSKISLNYRSFIGWRRKKVNLKYTNISGPYNARKSKGESINSSVWFFGGSTMWGTGTSDSQTIPSHFYSLTNIPVYNFGETGWNSRQSLNQLINTIGDNNNPSVVIFYDGVNDISHQCRSEIKLLPSHSREIRIQNALKPLPMKERISNFIISPYIAIARKFRIQFSDVNKSQYNSYDCDINEAKARSVAKHLVNNWRTAYSLSKSKNFKFYGVLQPTLFSTETNSEYLIYDEVKLYPEYKRQYNAVYPLILEEISRLCKLDEDICSSMIDGKDWLDGKNNIFIDFCHVNSLGNKVIAKRLKSLLKK